jgi:hypothetical protein
MLVNIIGFFKAGGILLDTFAGQSANNIMKVEPSMVLAADKGFPWIPIQSEK